MRVSVSGRRITAITAVAVVVLGSLAIAPAASAATSDVFFSEYIEGSSNNKALEIFNGTGGPVDLAAGGYQVEMYFNGSAAAGLTIPLTGTVTDGDVYVVAQASANATILAQADQTNGSGWFNGDDAIVLRKGGAGGPVVDAIGQVGLDPGTEWGTGLTTTADNTLRRKASISAGDTNPADAFDPAVEWDGFATDTFDGLGSHTIGGGPVDAPAVLTCGSTLTISAGQSASRTVTATDPDDTITDLAVTAVAPTPAAGSIARTSLTPASSSGGTASGTAPFMSSALPTA